MVLRKFMPYALIPVLITVVFAVPLHAALVRLDYTDSQLALKDFESMQSIVQKIKTRNLHMEDQDETRRINLKDAITVLFSRRDNDGTRAKLFRSLEADLDEDSADILETVVDESIENAKDSGLSVEERSTRLLILQNFIMELRPQMNKYRSLFEKIKAARLPVEDDVVKYRRLKGMAKADSPSDLAKALLSK